MKVINITINDHLMELPHIAVQVMPVEDGAHITTPYAFTPNMYNAFAGVLCRGPIRPLIELDSHKELYYLICFMRELKMSPGDILGSFAGWVDADEWMHLADDEYMYLLYTEMMELVSYKKYFRMSNKPYRHLRKAVKLTEFADPHKYISLIMFYKNYNIQGIFNENNRMVQERVAELVKERARVSDLFLINPHRLAPEYFEYTPCLTPAWSCEGISVHGPSTPGDRMLASHQECLGRLHDFTQGLLFRDGITLPWANIIVAGGAVSRWVSTLYDRTKSRQSDLDIFIFAKSYAERSAMFETVLRWFASSSTYYAIRGSVVSIYLKNVNRKFQIISSNAVTAFDIINEFDLSHVQWMYHNGDFYGTPEACISLRARVTEFNNTCRIRSFRAVKALHCGFNIIKHDKVEFIAEIVNNPKSVQVAKMIRELYGFYYPTSHPDMSAQDEQNHILCMIEKDSGATFTHNDIEFVLQNVVIGGNFENDYEMVNYHTFNPNMVVTWNGINKSLVTLKSKHAVIRLTTCKLIVKNVIANEIGMEVFTQPTEDDFNEFLRTLENIIYRMFADREANKMTVDGILAFEVSKFILQLQQSKGIAMMRDQRGQPLNIEEELRPGDTIQILFTIQVDKVSNVIKLIPIKFIKFCDDTTRREPISAEIPDDELVEALADTKVDAEIDYEE